MSVTSGPRGFDDSLPQLGPDLQSLDVQRRPQVQIIPGTLQTTATYQFDTSPGFIQPQPAVAPVQPAVAPQRVTGPTGGAYQQPPPKKVTSKFRRQPLKTGKQKAAKQEPSPPSDPRIIQYLQDNPQTQGTVTHTLNVLPAPETLLSETLTFDYELRSKEFLAILLFTLFGAIIFFLNARSNIEVVEIEQEFANGLSIGWFLVISLIIAVLLAHMVYKPYMVERAMGRNTILVAVIMYVVAEIAWSLTLFHTRINRGTAGIASILLLAATVWIGWICYQYFKETIFIFLLLLAWVFYLQDYTYNVDSHPWRAVPLGQTP